MIQESIKMFYLLECFSCGCPLGQFAYRMELAKIINFSQSSPAVVQLLTDLFSKFNKHQSELLDFILESIQHFDIFQTLDIERAMQQLISQYNTIYPYPEKTIGGELKTIIQSSSELHKLFVLLHENYKRGRCQKELLEDEDPQQKNTVYIFLKDNNVTRLCCRNSLLTFVDFYHTKNAL